MIKIKLPLKTKIFSAFLLTLFIGINSYCKKDKTSSEPTLSTPGVTIGKITVQGSVINENNTVVSGAIVKCGDVSSTTNSNGEFVLNNVPVTERSVLYVSANGFFDAYRGFNPASDQTSFMSVMILSKGNSKNFSSSTGAALSDNGGNVSIPANSLIDASGNPYTGSVKAFLRFQSPSQENFGLVMQGGDFAGVNTSSEMGTLNSYGFFSIELEDPNGAKLNIQPTSAAVFTMGIDPAQTSAPATVKLWSFDKTSGVWKEEGTATKNGNIYTGSVNHFSEWNCDSWNTTAHIKGKIVCNGAAVPNIEILLENGKNNKLYAYSNSNGEFKIKIPSGFTSTITINKIGSIPIKVLAKDEIFDLGTRDRCLTSKGEGSFTIWGKSYTGNYISGGVSSGTVAAYVMSCRDTINDAVVELFLYGKKPASSITYTVLPNSQLTKAEGEAVIYIRDNTHSGTSNSGSGIINVSILNGKIHASFSNIPAGFSEPTVATGSITLP